MECEKSPYHDVKKQDYLSGIPGYFKERFQCIGIKIAAGEGTLTCVSNPGFTDRKYIIFVLE